MTILAFTVEIEGAGDRATVRVIPTFVGDTPVERDALVQFVAELGQPDNPVRRALVALLETRPITGTE